MKKHELLAERNQLRTKLDQHQDKEALRRYEDDRRLIRLGLIPDRYITDPTIIYFTDSGDPIINWYRVEQDLKDLDTFKASERGRKIAEGAGQ